jgi:uncharacterized membrane protein
MHEVLLFGAAFLAGLVEMVEALTIVLAVGITRGWRSALIGVGTALVALVAIVAILGASLVELVPIDVLLVTVGVLLLIFGMQWVRKAILRASGYRAEHDEELIFAREVAELRAAGLPSRYDWTGFVVSFKGVFLEGLEIAFIVITFGANSGRTDLAAAGALTAFPIVVLLGLVVHKPLTRVPENAIKFTVGIMLMAFGTYWGAEGVGITWDLGAVSLLIITALYGLVAAALVARLKRIAGDTGLVTAESIAS